MNIRRIVPDIYSTKLEESKKFYIDYIGLKLAMDMGWILTFISKSNPTAQINIIKNEKPIDPNPGFSISIEVPDVKEMFEKAQSNQYKIVYPLSDEPWGVRRFFLLDPNGVTINIMCHINDSGDKQYTDQ